MSMWKNKHVVVAMLVAPVLAVMAYFAVDHFVGEQPEAAQPGAAYELIAKPNCRYASGQCDLKNADFELTLTAVDDGVSGVIVSMVSRFPLQGATIALADLPDLPSRPVQMNAEDAQQLNWSGGIGFPASAESALLLAVVANQSSYYAEVPVVFFAGNADDPR